MVKRKRLASTSSKPATSTTTTTTTAIPANSRRNGRQSNQLSTDQVDSAHLDVKRSRSTDSADSTAAPQVRGRSAPTSSSSTRANNENGRKQTDLFATIPDMDQPHLVEALSPVSDKISVLNQEQSESPPGNGRTRATKTSSVISSNSTSENPSIPQISVTDSSSTPTPSLVNGRASASESLSSLSELDTVDSEAETERMADFDEEPQNDSIPVVSTIVTSEDEIVADSGKSSPIRGRKRRRREDEEEKHEPHVENDDEEEEEEEEKLSHTEEKPVAEPEEPEEIEEAEPEEST